MAGNGARRDGDGRLVLDRSSGVSPLDDAGWHFPCAAECGIRIRLIDDWLSQPAVVTVEPTAQHFRILRDLMLPLGTGGNMTSDAHLAALAIEQDWHTRRK